VHESAAISPLERFAPLLVHTGRTLRFVSGHPQMVCDAAGLPIPPTEVAQLVIYSSVCAEGPSGEHLELSADGERACVSQPAWLVARGERCLARQELDNAGAWFHQALRLELRAGARRGHYGRTAVRALLGLSAVAAQQGIPENAYRFHRFALAYAPDDRALTFQAAELASATQREWEAAALFTKALTLGDIAP
jgi:hypothetical protein